MLALRRKHSCTAQSISYANTGALMFVRGEKEYLIDEAGERYLDTRNNVAHVPDRILPLGSNCPVLDTNS